MSEVKKFITRWSRDFQGNLQEDPNGSWVLAADAAIRDKRLMDKISALQQRLTAADERMDVLETALAGMLFAFDDGVGVDWSEDLLDFSRKLTSAKEFKSALKPAEPAKDEHACTGCGSKGWTANCKECVPY
ncbi:hypothetical protein [Pseudomonas sp. 'CRE Jenny 4']|uniref:hypothetical protein n=1 Tax=Pseudomonas sp. 'CRE Jenny 4' TaxID=3045817 RepID=UPI0025A2B92E|nr:hypothetical protein [Pseudomonas sp. 'CRE Jenny 4']